LDGFAFDSLRLRGRNLWGAWRDEDGEVNDGVVEDATRTLLDAAFEHSIVPLVRGSGDGEVIPRLFFVQSHSGMKQTALKSIKPNLGICSYLIIDYLDRYSKEILTCS